MDTIKIESFIKKYNKTNIENKKETKYILYKRYAQIIGKRCIK